MTRSMHLKNYATWAPFPAEVFAADSKSVLRDLGTGVGWKISEAWIQICIKALYPDIRHDHHDYFTVFNAILQAIQHLADMELDGVDSIRGVWIRDLGNLNTEAVAEVLRQRNTDPQPRISRTLIH